MRSREQWLREKLISSNLDFAKNIAIRYARLLDVDVDELFSYAMEGLVLAANKYDSSGKAKFTTFAYKRIVGAILNSPRKHSPVPHRIQNLYWRCLKIRKRYYKDNEFLTNAGITIEQWHNMRSAMQYFYFGLNRNDVTHESREGIAISKSRPILSELMKCFGFDNDVNHRKSGRKYVAVPEDIKERIRMLYGMGLGAISIAKRLNIKRAWVDKVIMEDAIEFRIKKLREHGINL